MAASTKKKSSGSRKEFEDRVVTPISSSAKETFQHNCYMERTTMAEVVRKMIDSYNKRISKKSA